MTKQTLANNIKLSQNKGKCTWVHKQIWHLWNIGGIPPDLFSTYNVSAGILYQVLVTVFPKKYGLIENWEHDGIGNYKTWCPRKLKLRSFGLKKRGTFWNTCWFELCVVLRTNKSYCREACVQTRQHAMSLWSCF